MDTNLLLLIVVLVLLFGGGGFVLEAAGVTGTPSTLGVEDPLL